MKKTIVMALAVIVAAAALAVYFFVAVPSAPTTANAPTAQPSEQQIRDKIASTYNSSNVSMTFNTSCQENQDKPCWRALVTKSEPFISRTTVAVDSATGVVVHDYTETLCKYTEYEATGYYNMATDYYNFGCDNPVPTCDVSGLCRACTSSADCVRRSDRKFTAGAVTQTLETQNYDAIGADIGGNFDAASQSCTISSNGADVFTGTTTIGQCELKMQSLVKCSAGVCEHA
jgi:hypothetical protein